MPGIQTDPSEPVRLAPHGGARIVAVCSQKGGVAMTTTCVNLAAGLAAAGLRVLVLDLDPQGNASRLLGTPPAERGVHEFLLGDGAPASTMMPSAVPGVMVVPPTSPQRLSEFAPAVAAMSAADLQTRLTAPDLGADVILIDYPPTLNPITINTLSTADLILIPVTPTTYGVDALDKTSTTITGLGDLRAGHVAVLLTMVDELDPGSVETAEAIRRRYSSFLLPMAVPIDAGHAEAASRNRPLLALFPEGRAATAYWRLAVAVMRLLQPLGLHSAAVPPVAAPIVATREPAAEPVLTASPSDSTDVIYVRESSLTSAPRRSGVGAMAVLAACLVGLVAGAVLAVSFERMAGISLAERIGLVAPPVPAPPAVTPPVTTPPPGIDPFCRQLDEIEK